MNYADVFTTNEFVDLCKAEDRLVYGAVMEDAGYFCVPVDPSGFWENAHTFLTKRYGKDNYVWTGEKFWFNSQAEAKEFHEFYRDWLEQ